MLKVLESDTLIIWLSDEGEWFGYYFFCSPPFSPITPEIVLKHLRKARAVDKIKKYFPEIVGEGIK